MGGSPAQRKVRQSTTSTSIATVACGGDRHSSRWRGSLGRYGAPTGPRRESPAVREGRGRLLAECGFDVPDQVEDAAAVMASVDRSPPDVLIVDVRSPPTSTVEGLRAALPIRDVTQRCACSYFPRTLESRTQ